MAQESKLETRLRERVKKLGGLAIKIFILMFTGFPDRIVLMPGGRFWIVEMKAPGGSLSPRQQTVHRKLRRMGFEVTVIWDEETLQNFFKIIEL
ncbi:VRR-NUC domain-containing protein [Chitinophaga rhizosphaerae]|uniref:VRR-NUC domain-containing protein n=1 Tax=Chitinophaga rhizosphaerae TaxID=1864947 RepID=UPI000F805FF8|nr:VRR-NUC domain-containing protein [Chitinophaga rhizosphaerae]